MFDLPKVLAVASLAALVAQAGLAQRTSEQVQQAIQKELEDDEIRLRVEVAGGVAKISGRARNVFEKNRAVEIALAESEIQSVDADVEVSGAESDQKLGEEVVKEIRKYSRITVFDDISAYIEKGNVALFGWVTEPYKKEEIEKRLHKIVGIQDFKNDIIVLSVSQSDERLRQALASRIYRDPSFSDFASMPIPPVHIIVSGSRVILTGVVGSQLMRQKAESIARGTPGVLSVENRLRIGS